MLPIETAFQVFTDRSGKPLENGYVYFGQPNQNPITAPITVYWDAAGTQPAVQPLRTVNGYIMRSGTPANVFINTAYSELVLDAKKRQVFYARTSDDFSVATSVIGYFATLLASGGAALVGFIQDAAGAVFRNLLDKNRDHVNLKDFGAKLDGITDDTNAWLAAIAHISTVGKPKKLVIPYGATGVSKLTASLNILVGGITLEWENSTITLKKFFNGDMFVVRAGVVKFVNPGLDGNGAAGFTGGGIRFGPATQFTFDCRIDNPRMRGTLDSCLLFEGPRGGAGIVVTGGSMLTYNPSGASSGGYPSVRVVGPGDNDVSNRTFFGVTSSAQPLIDFTGMAQTKVIGGFSSTFFFKGNPDVTGVGAPYGSCSEVYIQSVYIRDGMTMSGLEIMVDGCLTHGVAPLYAGAYGSAPTSFATYSYCMTVDTIACRMGPANVTSNGILDQSPNGHAIENQCSSFGYGKVMSTVWTGTVANPVLGNGSVLSTYDIDYKTVNFRVKLDIGSTTTRGTGRWSFDLPLWVSLYAPPVGNWLLIRPGFANLYGAVILTASGSTHRVSMSAEASAGGYLDELFPAVLPAGSQLLVDYSYSRG